MKRHVTNIFCLALIVSLILPVLVLGNPFLKKRALPDSIKVTKASATVLVQAGTPVFLVTHNEMDTKHLRTGMTICLYMKTPIKDGNYCIVPAGTPAYCKIIASEKPRGNGQPGYLELKPLFIETHSGEILPLSGNTISFSGSNRETEAMTHSQIVASTARVLSQTQNIIDVHRANQEIQQQTTSYKSTASPSLKDVAQALNDVVPLISLLSKGEHAVIPKGAIISTYVGVDTRVNLKQ